MRPIWLANGGLIGALVVALAPPGALGQEKSPSEPAAEERPEPTAAKSRRTVPLAGDDIQIVLHNRERIEGVFVGESATEYVVRIKSVDLRIDKRTVDRLVVLAPPIDRYREMRASINDDDVDRLVILARWLQRHELYVEAESELDHVLSVAPNHGGAIRLRKIVQELAQLENRRAPHEDPVRPGADGKEKDFGDQASLDPFALLTPDEINLIKVYEVRLEDHPRIVIPRSTIERLLVDYSSDPLIPSTREGREAFYVKPHTEILDTMFRVHARELYGRVNVIDHPDSLRRFRDHVHASWLINSCSTTRCHGGGRAGQLWLTNRRPTSPESFYSNFLILERYRRRDGEPLIDYENPERSLLLQMGLPTDDAIEAHPIVPGWSPVFRSRESRRFRQAVDWIRSMYRPRPTYPIEYDPPGERGGPEPVER